MAGHAPVPPAAPAGQGPAAPEPPTAPEAARRPMGRLVVAAAAVVVLVGLAAGGFFLFRGGGHPPAAEATAEPARATVPLGVVVVNVAGEAKRYLRVSVSLGVPSPKDVKEVDEARSQLLDMVITVLATAPADTLATEPGRAGLKTALLGRIHRELKLTRVGQVYFTEYVIQ